MTTRRANTARCAIALLSWAGLLGCSDGATHEPGTEGSAPTGKPPSTMSDEVPAATRSTGSPAAGSGAAPARDPNILLEDTCLVGGCAATTLPRQPDLPTLEDMGDGWQRLLELDWEVAAGAEGYRCLGVTIPEDIYVHAFAPQVPRGTHHSTYAVTEDEVRPDGEVFTCDTRDTGNRHIMGGAIGGQPNELPPGVAMRLSAGSQVHINLHLYNPGSEALKGRSGMWVKTMEKAAVMHEAEQVAMGPLQLHVPVGRSTQSGFCTLRDEATLFAIAPHMHATGVHARATALTSDGEILLFDGAYELENQIVHDIGPFELKRGDRVHVECTFENDTASPIDLGPSALDEMCFLGMTLHPAYGYGRDPCSF